MYSWRYVIRQTESREPTCSAAHHTTHITTPHTCQKKEKDGKGLKRLEKKLEKVKVDERKRIKERKKTKGQ